MPSASASGALQTAQPSGIQAPGVPQPVGVSTTADIANAQAWLAKLGAIYSATSAAAVAALINARNYDQNYFNGQAQASTYWANQDQSFSGWAQGAVDALKSNSTDLLRAGVIVNLFAPLVRDLEDPTGTGYGTLNVPTETAAISDLLDRLSGGGGAGLVAPSSGAGVAFTVSPVAPSTGTNVPVDANAQLTAFVSALASGDMASAQISLNRLAGDLRALGTQPAPPGAVKTSTAVVSTVGGLAVGGVIGGLVGHAIGSGLLFAGEAAAGAEEASETPRRRRKRR
jgi:hypothetical protein